MSDLSDAIERITEERQQNLDRMVVMIREDDDIPVDELAGVDVLILRESGDAIILRCGWGTSGVFVDVRAYIEGDQVETASMSLAGTTSVMADRP